MGRGKQYDLQKMIDLYNKGYSYQEIADELQIDMETGNATQYKISLVHFNDRDKKK